MTTTINKASERSYPPRTTRPRRARHFGRGRVPMRPNGIARDLEEAIDEKSSSPAAAFIAGAKAIVPVLLALLPFGLAFGATATGNGLSPVEALGMSVFVFAGAAQLAAVPLLSAGASVAIVLLTVLVVNLRLTLYSASLALHFGRLPAGWKGLLAYLLTDQAYAATITRFDEGETEEQNKRWYYLGVALAIWVTWQAATMLGVVLGAWASEGWSLDFVLPLIFIAAAVPAIKDRTTGAAALTAGVAALFAAALPLNLGLITAALVGVLGGLVVETLSEKSRR
jgi:4-azaleucine resistance transporter AzlC